MNLPNKITLVRIIISLLIVFILLFPFHALGITTMKLFINETIVIDIKYIISGILFIIGAITDFIDGYIARKYNMVTKLGKFLDGVADKLLINPILIILASQGLIHPLIPIIIISCDVLANNVKIVFGSKKKEKQLSIVNKVKTILLLIGVALTLFNNLPFELYNLKISNLLLAISTILVIYSMVIYIQTYKEESL